jgi:ABC-type sugar transport system ATPase subunit
VAGFLGTPRMNFLTGPDARSFAPVGEGTELGIRPEHLGLDGDVTARVDLVELAGADAYVHLSNGLVARVPADGRPREGDEVGVGVRPEHVHRFDRATGMRVES